MIRTVLLLGLLAASTSAAHAQSESQAKPLIPSLFNTRGTPEDQRACRPDAVKLCREFVDDDMAVLDCFKRNRSKLSKGCEAVLQKYNQ